MKAWMKRNGYDLLWWATVVVLVVAFGFGIREVNRKNEAKMRQHLREMEAKHQRTITRISFCGSDGHVARVCYASGWKDQQLVSDTWEFIDAVTGRKIVVVWECGPVVLEYLNREEWEKQSAQPKESARGGEEEG